MGTDTFFPLADKDLLVKTYVGQSLQNAPIPSAILDIAKVKENCQRMLQTVHKLPDISFRAHVKTHKTLELTRLQVGLDSKDVRLVCSTVAELEHLIPLINEYRDKGATVSVLFGLPLAASHRDRLVTFVQNEGSSILAFMIDHPAQLDIVKQISALTKTVIPIFLKTDSGYHRAGLPPTSLSMTALVKATLQLETESSVHLLGFYSHNSLSYGGSSPQDAMDYLSSEIDACITAVSYCLPAEVLSTRDRHLVISCGASPSALSLQNFQTQSSDSAVGIAEMRLRASLATARERKLEFEVHAGVYPLLDMQQISAASRGDAHLGGTRQSYDAIAFSVLSEVCSTYVDRETSEALINAGGLALAREPCKSYRGHGVISPWNMAPDYNAHEPDTRIIVDRVSQEHGILQWDNKASQDALPIQYGQRVRIWPNHACITGAQYGWYLIMDSSSDDEDIVRDVWVRWRGW